MKFNSKLSDRENVMAWKEHHSSAPHTQYDLLNEGEKAWLRAFNETLRQLEDKYFSILDAKHKELQARVADPSDWLLDFNLEYFITFYLREDDPEYDEDDDNILTVIADVLWDFSFGIDRDSGFGSTHVNHAEPCAYPPNESHCYLYHHLYDHCYLDKRDLFRIGELQFEIKIDEQSGKLPVNPVS